MDFIRIHSFKDMLYKDLTEDKTIGDAKLALLHRFPVFQSQKSGTKKTTEQCRDYQTLSNLQFRPLLTNFFS